MATVAFLNQKGGVGKTSCCHHLAGALAELGRRVLLVDCDPQASLTQGLLGPSEAEALHPATTIAEVLDGGEPDAAGVIRPTEFQRINLVPGSVFAAEYNAPRPWELPREKRLGLRDWLGACVEDLCLIDCPPNLQLCSWAAVAAADAVVIPVQPEDYGAQGVSPVLEFLGRVRNTDAPRVELAGLLLSMLDRRLTVHKTYEIAIRHQFGSKVFNVPLARLAAFAEAVSHHAPVTCYAPRSAAAECVRAVAADLLTRILGAERQAGLAAGKAVSR
jgi:chromosome partitioning protein